MSLQTPPPSPPPPVFFIEFEAFQHGDESFIIKELCVLSVRQPLKPLHFVFKAPAPWNSLSVTQRRTYTYQYRNLHNLSWEEGVEKRYCRKCVERRIQQATMMNQPEPLFYVLGEQKAEFLKKEFPSLHIVEYKHIHTFKDLNSYDLTHLTCPYRDHNYVHCALLKCYRLYTHFMSL